MPLQLRGEHAVLQPLRRSCVPNFMISSQSAHYIDLFHRLIELIHNRTHYHLCPTRYSFTTESSEARQGEEPCPRTQHQNNFPTLRGEKMTFLCKSNSMRGLKPHAGSPNYKETCCSHCATTLSHCQSSFKFEATTWFSIRVREHKLTYEDWLLNPHVTRRFKSHSS